jgi:hypothetical protein
MVKLMCRDLFEHYVQNKKVTDTRRDKLILTHQRSDFASYQLHKERGDMDMRWLLEVLC